MKHKLAVFVLSAALPVALVGNSGAPEAATAGCISFNQVPGSHNWQFQNNCGIRTEVVGDSQQERPIRHGGS